MQNIVGRKSRWEWRWEDECVCARGTTKRTRRHHHHHHQLTLISGCSASSLVIHTLTALKKIYSIRFLLGRQFLASIWNHRAQFKLVLNCLDSSVSRSTIANGSPYHHTTTELILSHQHVYTHTHTNPGIAILLHNFKKYLQFNCDSANFSREHNKHKGWKIWANKDDNNSNMRKILLLVTPQTWNPRAFYFWHIFIIIEFGERVPNTLRMSTAAPPPTSSLLYNFFTLRGDPIFFCW